MPPKLDTSDLPALAHHLLSTGPVKTAPTTRRVRALFNGSYIVDTTRAQHVWEHEYYPQLYVPYAELQSCECEDLEGIGRDDGMSEAAAIVKLTVTGEADQGGKSTERVIRFFDGARVLSGYVRLEFAAMDTWLEEDTPIYVHPKDPYKRIDILPSSRPVVVSLAGHVLARSAYSLHLLETKLPTRYYIPLAAVDAAVLRPSSTTSRCPYKGEAEYYDVVVGGQTYRDLVWWYRYPTSESAPIAGLLCFWNEKVDVEIDGVKLGRPETVFS